MKGDTILDEMAKELRDALVKRGIDPVDHPQDSYPPSTAAFAEYKRRGGSVYKEPNLFIEALVERVKSNGTNE